jgi:mono/diheme cytochrome c family protein
MRLITALAVAIGVFWSTAAMAQDQAKIDQGMKVYAAQKCSVCHSVAGKGNAKGPLDSVGKTLSADDLHQWLVNPAEMAKKANSTRKPPMKSYANLSKDDQDALVAYMLSLKK